METDKMIEIMQGAIAIIIVIGVVVMIALGKSMDGLGDGLSLILGFYFGAKAVALSGNSIGRSSGTTEMVSNPTTTTVGPSVAAMPSAQVDCASSNTTAVVSNAPVPTAQTTVVAPVTPATTDVITPASPAVTAIDPNVDNQSAVPGS